MATNIFSLENHQSVLVQILCSIDTIDLSAYKMDMFSPDESYTTEERNIGSSEELKQGYDLLEEICQEHITDPERFVGFRNAIQEAMKNAYQHGNQKDGKKKVHIAYRNQNGTFEVVIGDQGGVICSQFLPYLLCVREQKKIGSAIGGKYFYQFAKENLNRPRNYDPNQNSGIGTRIMHEYTDGVHYFKNLHGGLSVQMKLTQ